MKNESKKTFGEFITQRRRALGMTQREFSDKLFVTDSAVSKWERGLSYPDITLIRDICEILGVSEHELLTASEDIEARNAERLAARYRRISRNYKLVQYVLYGGTIITCLICDLADGGNFGWSLIVAASLFIAASLTLLPALAPERMGGAASCMGVMLSLCLLYGAVCLSTGGDWFLPAALGTLFGLWLLLGAYILRRIPLPGSFKHRKALLYVLASIFLLLALLGVCCLRARQDWFFTAALGVLLGAAILLLPLVIRQVPLPNEVQNHKALLWLAIVTVLLAALIPVAGARYLWSEAYPLMLLGMLWPWLMLLCLRYLPIGRWFRVSASFFVTALYIWLAPCGVELIAAANGWDVIKGYDLFNPYGANFSDWNHEPYLTGNIFVTIMAALIIAAIVCLITGIKHKK